MNTLLSEMVSRRNPQQVPGLSRFFRTGPGQYGEGDLFLGIKVPETRNVVRSLWKETGMDHLEECIRSPYHEIRLAALLVLVEKFKHSAEKGRPEYVDFYMSHTVYINNWDLVDLSCYNILGTWLLDKDRTILHTLAKEGRTIWERRIGMVSTMAMVRRGELDDTYAIADILLQDKGLHDLLQKAAGWLLREAGKRDAERLVSWLEPRRLTMPRTMLRYAIEKLDEGLRRTLMDREP